MFLQWLLLFCVFVDEILTGNFTEVIEPIKNETNRTSLIDRTYCNYENKETSVYEFPWLVGIAALGWTICSGTLINSRYVLKSAQCSSNIAGYSSLLYVVINDINLKSNHTNCNKFTSTMEDECLHSDKYGIEEIIPHPLYNVSTSADYNIGLLRLDRTVEYKEYIRPICLPTFQTATPKPGDTLYLSVWRIMYDEELGKDRIKKKLSTTLITRAECRDKIKKCNNSDFYTLYDNNECIIVEPDVDDGFDRIPAPGSGDTGGAVMSFNNNQWKMEGILSTSIRLSCKDKPVIYTRISMYLDWIEENMRPWN